MDSPTPADIDAMLREYWDAGWPELPTASEDDMRETIRSAVRAVLIGDRDIGEA